MNKQKDKKGQEEMVGFILIVVLVTIIAIVFLGIYTLKKPNIESRQSDLLQSFINSMTYYTTDCLNNDNTFNDIEALINECQDNSLCSDGRFACQVLDKTLKDILSESYPITNNSFTRYYNLSILSGEGNGQKPLIKEITAGNSEKCNGPRFYNQKTIPSSSREKVTIKLEICNTKLQ